MSRLASAEEIRLLTKVSKLYYEEGIRQDEIVTRLNISRSKISRLLQRARDEGIVRITVIEPPGIHADLENQLEKRFRLQEVVVVEAHQPEVASTVAREIGIGAAGYLERTLQPADIVGISWGSTLHEMVEALEPASMPEVNIVQVIGGLGQPESEMHATDLCRRMSHRLNSKLTLLPAPGIVDSQQTWAVFLSDSHVQRALGLFQHINVVYVGIGTPAADSVVMRDGSIIAPAELTHLIECGAVGDIALRYFDAFGQPVPSDLDQRVIGIELAGLSKVARVVGVAGGSRKIAAILGALRGRLINVLITDHVTAARLLEAGPQLKAR
jgi:DNA-binding transcriptional regulator LsrR (DeoR family)